MVIGVVFVHIPNLLAGIESLLAGIQSLLAGIRNLLAGIRNLLAGIHAYLLARIQNCRREVMSDVVTRLSWGTF